MANTYKFIGKIGFLKREGNANGETKENEAIVGERYAMKQSF